MFGRSSRKPFKPYTLGASKPRRRLPGWLVALVLGFVGGAAGLLYVQQEHMAPRLSAGESQQITMQAAQMSDALAKTQAQLDQANKDLVAKQAENENLSQNLARAQTALKPLQEDLALLQEVLPADPRGGDLQIRAGRFYNEAEGLSYHVVLTQNESAKAAFEGSLQFVVQGRYPNGRTASLALDPVPLEVAGFQNMHGTVPLPDGLQASQITTRVLNGDGATSAMRVINSRN